MTEEDWLAATEPDDILEFVRHRASDRQLRLFMAACCRRFVSIMPKTPKVDLRFCITAIENSERFADGLISPAELSRGLTVEDWVKVSSDGYLAATAARKLTYAKIAGSPLPMLRGRNVIAHPASEVAGYSRAVVSRLQQQCKTSAGSTPAAKKRLATIAEKRFQIGLLRDVFGNPFRPLPPERGNNAWLKNWRRCLAWKGATVVSLARTIYEERQFDGLPMLADALEMAGCSEATVLGHCREPGPHVRGCWVVDLILDKRRT